MKKISLSLTLALTTFTALALGCGGMEGKLEELAAQGEVAMAEGQSFGSGTDQDTCLSESLNRAEACTGSVMEKGTCQGMAQVFLQGCLDMSAASEGFCEGAPAQDQIMDMVNWGIAQCEAAGRTHDSCGNLMQTRAEWCNGQ
ncbi:MAG: hypothetical protein VX899_00595 [Myxococcota bacterium]|nr:hypothetical protein [Myxococcota bacterium]